MKITEKLNTYQGRYRDVGFEIVYNERLKHIYFDNPSLHIDTIRLMFICNNFNDYSIDKEWWTYYIYIELENLPDRVNPDSFWLPFENISNSFMDYRYTDHKILNEIYFYGGITFYSKSSGLEEGNPKIIKVGCDFAHLCDQDRHYSVEDIQEHVKVTIDSLYEVIPEYGKEEEVNNEK